VIADGRRVVSLGYNGMPQGVQDLSERYENRDLKYKMILHAERNAIIFAREPLRGYTAYTSPIRSCAVCAGMLIQAGIKRIVAPDTVNPRWEEDFRLAKQMYDEARVDLHLIENFRVADVLVQAQI
jgi:dCMP deaminase